MYVCMYIHTYIYINIYIHTQTNKNTQAHMYIYTCTTQQGFCSVQGKCQVCKESGDPKDDRCQAGTGIRQRCVNGKVSMYVCIHVYFVDVCVFMRIFVC